MLWVGLNRINHVNCAEKNESWTRFIGAAGNKRFACLITDFVRLPEVSGTEPAILTPEYLVRACRCAY